MYIYIYIYIYIYPYPYIICKHYFSNFKITLPVFCHMKQLIILLLNISYE